jgi:hypothetical protein
MEDAWALDRVQWAEPLFLGIILALLAAAAVIRRTARSLAGVARYLALFFGLLAGFALVRLGLQASAAGDQLPIQPRATAPRSPGARRLPDIYLIVPDKYTGSRFLAKHYDFDNGSFERFLTDRGFLLPAQARTNYVHTFLALAAMLNLRYLDDLPGKLGPESRSRRAIDGMIERNELMRVLRGRGYRIVFTPTAFAMTRRNRLADLQIPSPDRIRPEFVTAWAWTTPIPVLHVAVCRLLGCAMASASYPPESADLLDWKFAQLERLAGGEQPTFALIHLTIPHEPYVYWRDCRHRPPYWPEEETRAREAYVEQIRCLNRKLERLVVVLQERSPVPPVILIQSDHGHGRIGWRLPPLERVTLERREERASAFAAYHLPGVPSNQVANTITPVNAVRLVLRRYLDAELAPLEDATYWSSTERPYRFVRLPPEGAD